MKRRLICALLAFALVGLPAGIVPPVAAQSSDTRESSGGFPWWQILSSVGGAVGIYEIFHHHTQSREPSPPPSASPSPGPSTTSAPTAPPTEVPTGPPPTPYPSPTPTPELACKYVETDGWFEPAQGAWQDDKHFPDLPGKRIVRLRDMEPVPHYKAELNMVADRDTLLFGIEHYNEHSVEVPAGSHDNIVIEYKTDCTQIDAVRFAFTVTSGGASTSFVEPRTFFIPLHGRPAPNGTMRQITVTLPVRDGAPSLPRKPFFVGSGGYQIVAELAKNNGAGTGLKVVVDGNAVKTQMPLVHFVPTHLGFRKYGFLSKYSSSFRSDEEVIGWATALADASRMNIPDMYPIKADSMKTIVEEPFWVDYEDIRNSAIGGVAREAWGVIISSVNPQSASEAADIVAKAPITERLTASLIANQTLRAYLNGTDRVVIVMNEQDFHAVEANGKGAENLGNKIIIAPHTADYYDVGHEVAHTIPPQNWDPNTECGVAYHNSAPTGIIPHLRAAGHNELSGIAGGERVRFAGKLGKREREDDLYHLMGSTVAGIGKGFDVDKWIEQCTFWHLVKQLPNPPDPPVTFLRGFFLNNGRLHAMLGPLYQFDGSSDFTPASSGSLSIVARDRSGGELARYRFTPSFKNENGVTRRISPFAFHVPVIAGTASYEIDGPGGKLAGVRLSPVPPVVRVDPPVLERRGADRFVTVRWHAQAAHGYPLFSTVFYSPDGGTSNYTELLEKENTNTVTFKLQPRQFAPRVRVIVTDYTRSVERQAAIPSR
jgi:hypothetical protein